MHCRRPIVTLFNDVLRDRFRERVISPTLHFLDIYEDLVFPRQTRLSSAPDLPTLDPLSRGYFLDFNSRFSLDGTHMNPIYVDILGAGIEKIGELFGGQEQS